MYRLKIGVPVKAIQFLGLNFMEIFTLVPNATSFITTPNEDIAISYWDRPRSDRFINRSLLRVELKQYQWLVVDESGPLVINDDAFQKRYERMPDDNH